MTQKKGSVCFGELFRLFSSSFSSGDLMVDFYECIPDFARGEKEGSADLALHFPPLFFFFSFVYSAVKTFSPLLLPFSPSH